MSKSALRAVRILAGGGCSPLGLRVYCLIVEILEGTVRQEPKGRYGDFRTCCEDKCLICRVIV
jgi:hypothetical protein